MAGAGLSVPCDAKQPEPLRRGLFYCGALPKALMPKVLALKEQKRSVLVAVHAHMLFLIRQNKKAVLL